MRPGSPARVLIDAAPEGLLATLCAIPDQLRSPSPPPPCDRLAASFERHPCSSSAGLLHSSPLPQLSKTRIVNPPPITTAPSPTRKHHQQQQPMQPIVWLPCCTPAPPLGAHLNVGAAASAGSVWAAGLVGRRSARVSSARCRPSGPHSCCSSTHLAPHVFPQLQASIHT